MFIKKLILFLLLVTPLLANDSDTKIIINVNDHAHYLPDSVSKQILDVYFVNKDSIEDIITDRSTTDFTVGKAELPDIIGGIRFVKTGVNDEVDIYADASDGRFTVSTTWKAPPLVNVVAGLFGIPPDPTFLWTDVDFTASFYLHARAKVYTDTMLVGPHRKEIK